MTGSAPTVSAIVVTYDHPDFPPGTLDSAIAQDYPADRPGVVVLDDGSTDRTPEIIREYEQRHPGRVRGFRQQNAGYENATAVLTRSRPRLLATGLAAERIELLRALATAQPAGA